MLNKCSLLLSSTSGAGFKSSPPHSDAWKPTKLVPLIPRGWRTMAVALAQHGPHLLSLQALHHPESAGSWLWAKATMSPPLYPPGPGAHLFTAGTGLVCGRGWGRMSGNTILSAWGIAQGPSDRGLGVRPAWPARRTGGADLCEGSPCLASAQILRRD